MDVLKEACRWIDWKLQGSPIQTIPEQHMAAGLNYFFKRITVLF
jgi:hypothetical protein